MQDKINITAKGHNVSVTSTSLAIDDREYLYKGITAIKHSSAKQLYAFKYNGKWEMLGYDDESEKKIIAVFKQIAELIKRRKAAEQMAASPVKQGGAPAAEVPVAEIPRGSSAGETAGIAPAAEIPVVNTQAGTSVQTYKAPSDEAVAAETGSGAEADGAAEEKSSASEDLAKALMDVEGMEPEEAKKKRKGKLRKSIIVLVAVLAVFAAAGIAYFFLWGSSTDASRNPNTDTTHQYNDIDELIDEMQE